MRTPSGLTSARSPATTARVAFSLSTVSSGWSRKYDRHCVRAEWRFLPGVGGIGGGLGGLFAGIVGVHLLIADDLCLRAET